MSTRTCITTILMILLMTGGLKADLFDWVSEQVEGSGNVDKGTMLDVAADTVTKTVKNSSVMQGLIESKKTLLFERKSLQATQKALVSQANQIKNQALNSYKSFRAANPNIGALQAAKNVNLKTNFLNRGQVVQSQLSKVKKGLTQTRVKAAGMNKGIANVTGWGNKVKGTLKAGARFFEAIDIAGATGRVFGEASHAVFGDGSFQNVLIAASNEVGRMKTTSLAAAGGAAAGGTTGPLAPIASPLLASTASVLAGEAYDRTVGELHDKAKQIISDRTARDTFAAKGRALADARADARAMSAFRSRVAEMKAKLDEQSQTIEQYIQFQKDLDAQLAAEDRARREAERRYEMQGPYTVVQTTEVKEAIPGSTLRVWVAVAGGKGPYELSGAASGSIGEEREWYELVAPQKPGVHSFTLTATDKNDRKTSHTLKLTVKKMEQAFVRSFTATGRTASLGVKGARIWMVTHYADGKDDVYTFWGEQVEPMVEVTFQGSTTHTKADAGQLLFSSIGVKPAGNYPREDYHEPTMAGGDVFTTEEQPTVAKSWTLRFPWKSDSTQLLANVSARYGKKWLAAKLELDAKGDFEPPSPRKLKGLKIVYLDPESPQWQDLSPQEQKDIEARDKAFREAMRKAMGSG
jgi:hypothetical protein